MVAWVVVSALAVGIFLSRNQLALHQRLEALRAEVKALHDELRAARAESREGLTSMAAWTVHETEKQITASETAVAERLFRRIAEANQRYLDGSD